MADHSQRMPVSAGRYRELIITSCVMRNAAIVAAYERKTPGSARLSARARQVFPGGVTHDTRLLEPYPLAIARAKGARKWDVDGNEYVDYIGGHGALLLGHTHPVVSQAVSEQLAKGTHYGAA